MRKGTAPNPDHRYAHASDLMNDIEQVMGVTSETEGGTQRSDGQSPSRTAKLSDFLHTTDPLKFKFKKRKTSMARRIWHGLVDKDASY
ncbi:MAG UNVERIFIED_CONTAM: hypothetical protein LVT10_16615 [Anaerolineae bacterium]|jgi:hypothetical protein